MCVASASSCICVFCSMWTERPHVVHSWLEFTLSFVCKKKPKHWENAHLQTHQLIQSRVNDPQERERPSWWFSPVSSGVSGVSDAHWLSSFWCFRCLSRGLSSEWWHDVTLYWHVLVYWWQIPINTSVCIQMPHYSRQRVSAGVMWS